MPKGTVLPDDRKYHKINGIFKRDRDNKNRFIHGEFSTDAFRFLAESEWIFQEKMDGTNMRVLGICGSDDVRIGGRSNNADLHQPVVDVIQAALETMPFSLTFTEEEFWQGATVMMVGEGIGGKIQSPMGANYGDMDFVLFDVLVGETWWLPQEQVETIAGLFGLRFAPIVGSGTIQEGIDLVTGGFKSAWGDFNAEGVIARPAVPLRDSYGDRIITKLKTVDFPQ